MSECQQLDLGRPTLASVDGAFERVDGLTQLLTFPTHRRELHCGWLGFRRTPLLARHESNSWRMAVHSSSIARCIAAAALDVPTDQALHRVEVQRFRDRLDTAVGFQ